MLNALERLVVPGLVIQAVIVGGGYATGRELVEFFLSMGPRSALLGMVITAALFSVGAMISFELARLHRTFDYRSFCRVYLGRFAVLFEAGYFASLLLVLAVVSAAAARLLEETLGWSATISAVLFLLIVAFLVFFGNRAIERVISAWSILFYLTYLTLFLLVLWRFGDAMDAALSAGSLQWAKAAGNGISYTGYNICVLPILIFVARHFTTRSEALIAGALAGPLILLPGIAFLLTLTAFYPSILTAPLPVSIVLEQLDSSFLTGVIRLVILGALIKTGAGLLHGLNERISRAMSDRQRDMPRWLRPAVAAVALGLAVYVATTIGLIDLIGEGYRYSSVYFLLVFLLPLLTRGAWLVFKATPAALKPVALVALLCCFPGTSRAQNLEAYVDGLIASRMPPGAVVVVVKDDQVLLAKGYGWANIEKRRAVDAERTLFRIGSITKLFTHTAVMQLAERGKIDLNADINAYLDDEHLEPAFGLPVTVNHLMAHRGGFESGDLGYDFFGDASRVPTLAELIQHHELRRVRKPGELTAYSNFGVSTLGRAVERVSHTPYSSYIEMNILAPLKMARTTLREPAQPGRGTRQDLMPPELAADLATPYSRNQPLPYEYIAPAAAPAGSMFTTGADMARFMRMWLRGGELDGARILQPRTVQLAFTRAFSDRPDATDFAHGFFNGRMAGHASFGHTGSMLGFRSSLQLIPDLQLGVFSAVSSEEGWALASELPRLIALYLAADPPSQPAVYAENNLSQYAGQYFTTRRSYTRLEKFLKIDSGQASVTPTAKGTLRIVRAGDAREWLPIAPLLFQDTGSEDRVIFQKSSDGRVLRFYAPLGHEAFERRGWLDSPQLVHATMGLSGLLALTILITTSSRLQLPRASRFIALGTAFAALLVLILLVLIFAAVMQLAALGALTAFSWPTPLLSAAIGCAKILTLAAALLLVSLWPVWTCLSWPLSRRVHHSVFAIALLALLLTLAHWNLFSSPYN